MLNKIDIGGSTPPMLNEVWVVIVGKQRFELSGEQVAILKRADTSGQRGIIWFDKFAINLFNIECLYLDRTIPKNAISAGTMQGNPISDEQREKNRKKISEIKDRLRGGLSVKNKPNLTP